MMHAAVTAKHPVEHRASRHPELHDREFALLSRLIHERSGIALGETKRGLLHARLSRRLRALKLHSFREYCEYVTRGDGRRSETARMIEAICTHKTAFFREPAHFDYLARHCFPLWRNDPVIRILSAGCSHGEEAYSVAIRCREELGALADQKVKILAGEISAQALSRAREGIYAQKELHPVSTARLHAFFLKGEGSKAGLVKVAPEIQRLVTFQHLNLKEPLRFSSHFQAIFCRNVLIYFDRATQEHVLRSLYHALAPGGFLFLGHSESMIGADGGHGTGHSYAFEYVQPTVYRKPERQGSGVRGQTAGVRGQGSDGRGQGSGVRGQTGGVRNPHP